MVSSGLLILWNSPFTSSRIIPSMALRISCLMSQARLYFSFVLHGVLSSCFRRAETSLTTYPLQDTSPIESVPPPAVAAIAMGTGGSRTKHGAGCCSNN